MTWSAAGGGTIVMDGAVAQDRIIELIDDFGRAVDEESALGQRLDDIRSRKTRLDHQLLEARQEASRSVLAASRRESELLLVTAQERLRMAEMDAAEQLVRSGAERRALVARLERIEAQCDELLAKVALLADGAREPTIIIDDRTPEASPRNRWQPFGRDRRKLDAKRQRHDRAISERINRVMSANAGATVTAEEVEARIRNMSHGTNGL
jgi:chromosome segregation ATPase